MNKYALFLLLPLSACPGFGQRFKDNYAECAPASLTEAIPDVLGAADWRTAVQGKILAYGIEAVACAIEAFYKTATAPKDSRVQTFIQLPPDTLRTDRAELWLRANGRLK